MDQQQIKIYLNGLIRRDPEAPSKEWLASPAGLAYQAEQRERAERFRRDEIRIVSLTAPGSIRWIEVDRAGLRALITEGWKFDDNTTQWANQEPTP